MKTKTVNITIACCLFSLIACSQQEEPFTKKAEEVTKQKKEKIQSEPHRYGGWYCPDNLNRFPAVDLTNWKKVPVVTGRLATKEETQNGSALIFVDLEKYPNAKTLGLSLPQLARFYNASSNRDELIVVIQALNISNDSIVGFRYLNGGNGSARLDEVQFLSEQEIEQLPATQFVMQTIKINAPQAVIWNVLTQPEHTATLQQTFDQKQQLKADWRKTTNVNFQYSAAGEFTASYAGELYGNYYVQNDYDDSDYTEKFLLLENPETKMTELKIVCGPYGADYATQKSNLEKWARKVKELSEQ